MWTPAVKLAKIVLAILIVSDWCFCAMVGEKAIVVLEMEGKKSTLLMEIKDK